MNDNNIGRMCIQLSSKDRETKTRALIGLRGAIELDTLNTQEVRRIFDNLYLYLLNCYADRFEDVRNNAVLTVNVFLKRLPPADFHLVNIMTTLVERMGQTETVETSEELRLLYIEQFHLLVGQYRTMGSIKVFRECYGQVMRVLNKALRDIFPEVQRETCRIIIELARAVDPFELKPHAESLAIGLYGMLNHKHSQSRIVATEALGQIALHIDTNGDGLRRLIMEVSPLLMDKMPLVRAQCGQMGVLMLMELYDRYSFFDRIIPLVLCCLKDESPEVVNLIRPMWIKCGKLYYDENEEELSKQEIGDLPAENYPPDVERPTIGCRGLVQRSLRLVHTIIRETTDWKENVRLHSLKLLYQFVLHAEAAMTAKFFEIYPDLARVCMDSDKYVRAEAEKVAELMGRLLRYDDWIEHGLNGLQKVNKYAHLVCFENMFRVANGGTYEQLLTIAELLRTKEYSHTLKPDFQTYIIKTSSTILDKSTKLTAKQDDLDVLYKLIYVSDLKVMGLSYSLTSSMSSNINSGQEIIEKMAKLQNTNIWALHEQFFTFVLQDIDNLDAALDESSEPVLLLDGLINLCQLRASGLPELIEKIKLVFTHCSDSAKVRIFGSLSIAALTWDTTINCASKREPLMSLFLNEIVEPHLIWQAGASAEAMRSLATATLCSLAQGSPNEAAETLPPLAKYMPSLLEDHNVTTRHYAVKAVEHFKNLTVQELKPLAYATLQRLDDPSAGIRLLAAAAVCKLQPVFTATSDKDLKFEREIWDSFIKRAIEILQLHSESPEKQMKVVAADSLQRLTQDNPICWLERSLVDAPRPREPEELEEVFEKLDVAEEEVSLAEESNVY